MKLTENNNKETVIKNKPFDRLKWAGKLLIALFGITLIFMGIPLLDHFFRPPDDSIGYVIRELDLSNLSIIGSGKPLRHPESIMTMGGLNFSPHFSRFMINAEFLILNPPQDFSGHVTP